MEPTYCGQSLVHPHHVIDKSTYCTGIWCAPVLGYGERVWLHPEDGRLCAVPRVSELTIVWRSGDKFMTCYREHDASIESTALRVHERLKVAPAAPRPASEPASTSAGGSGQLSVQDAEEAFKAAGAQFVLATVDLVSAWRSAIMPGREDRSE